MTPPLKHGASVQRKKTPEYRCWSHMKNRCLNPRNASYSRYGGRGIAVCERWADSFEAFLADMGPRPTPTHSIDRIDNDGNYEPGNCRWATRAEQNANYSRNRAITIGDETRLLGEWAAAAGLDPQTISARIARGWPAESAVSTPVGEVEAHRPGRDRKTHCPAGHKYTPETSGRNAAGWRFCRICSRARQTEYMRARRARKKQ